MVLRVRSRPWVLDSGIWVSGPGSPVLGPESWVPIYSIVITECDKKLLQSVTSIAQCEMKLLQMVTGITKCDKKLWQSVTGNINVIVIRKQKEKLVLSHWLFSQKGPSYMFDWFWMCLCFYVSNMLGVLLRNDIHVALLWILVLKRIIFLFLKDLSFDDYLDHMMILVLAQVSSWCNTGVGKSLYSKMYQSSSVSWKKIHNQLYSQ